MAVGIVSILESTDAPFKSDWVDLQSQQVPFFYIIRKNK